MLSNAPIREFHPKANKIELVVHSVRCGISNDFWCPRGLASSSVEKFLKHHIKCQQFSCAWTELHDNFGGSKTNPTNIRRNITSN